MAREWDEPTAQGQSTTVNVDEDDLFGGLENEIAFGGQGGVDVMSPPITSSSDEEDDR